MWDDDTIHRALERLGNRAWPEHGWSQTEQDEVGDFLGWIHRYQLDELADEQLVESFEVQVGVDLPEDYRSFLLEMGNGGCGPAYGIFALGENDDRPLPREVLLSLSTDFKHRKGWNLNHPAGVPLPKDLEVNNSYYYGLELIAGAMPISTAGCALDYLLVVAGPCRGQIWFDQRTDGKGITPVLNHDGKRVDFYSWWTDWLEDCIERWA